MSSTCVSKLSAWIVNFQACQKSRRIGVHHLRDVLFCGQPMRRRPINVSLFEIDRPIEGNIRRRDLGVVGLRRRIFDGNLGSHDRD